MARPKRGRDGEWSLNQIAAEAGVTRGIARTALARGYLPAGGPHVETDIVLLRVAAACLAYPDPTVELPAKTTPGADRLRTRDALTVQYVLAILGNPRAELSSGVLLAGKTVRQVASFDGLAEAVRSLPPHAVMFLPVGMWRGLLPSAVNARAAERYRAAQLSTPAPGRPALLEQVRAGTAMTGPVRVAVQENNHGVFHVGSLVEEFVSSQAPEPAAGRVTESPGEPW